MMSTLINTLDILKNHDPILCAFVQKELDRQQNQIELIASENIVSPAVMSAQGSVLTNKYAEGYPGRRYYGGCEFVDEIEILAIERLKKIFNCQFANVQPHSGAQANQGVFLALLSPGDTILGMSLNSGGHLTHGSSVNMSGKWFHAVGYDVNPETHLIDYDEVERLAHLHKPKLLIAGGSAYPRVIDFAKFRAIADAVGATFMVDMAHFSGLVGGGVYPSPLPHAHVVTSTTHKTLRGPRGGIILTNDENLAKKINTAMFPGLQGGPLMHVIAAKAVAFGEVLQPAFKTYAQQIVTNAQAMADVLKKNGFSLISGGTDSHLILIDLRTKGVNGKDTCQTLENAHITCNKNSIPFDPTPPSVTSGIRIGTPAITTRGFQISDVQNVAELMTEIVDGLGKGHTDIVPRVKAQAIALCQKFPIYPGLRYD